MKKLLYVAVFLTLSTAYFLFWPEFKYEITCAQTPGAQLQGLEGCSASDPQYDFSEVRFRAGLSWIGSQNICIKTSNGCEPQPPAVANEATYSSPVPMPLVLIGSISLAALSTYAIAILTRKRIRN